MAPLTGNEEEEQFFGSYDAERTSTAALDFEPETEPPTQAELAHLARFRKPVALAVSAMALFSLAALEQHGTRPSQRALVAHYCSAITAPTAAASAALVQAAPSAQVSGISFDPSR